MENSEVDGRVLIAGIVSCLILAPLLCMTSIAPLGIVVMVVGMIMIIFGSGMNPQKSETSVCSCNEDHYHLHQHNYPVQTYVEGREYAVTRPDGSVQSMRFIKRLN